MIPPNNDMSESKRLPRINTGLENAILCNICGRSGHAGQACAANTQIFIWYLLTNLMENLISLHLQL